MLVGDPAIEIVVVEGERPGWSEVTASVRGAPLFATVQTVQAPGATWRGRLADGAWSPPCASADDAIRTQIALLHTCRALPPLRA